VLISSRYLPEIVEKNGILAPRICMVLVLPTVDVVWKSSDGDEAIVVQCGMFLEVRIEMRESRSVVNQAIALLCI